MIQASLEEGGGRSQRPVYSLCEKFNRVWKGKGISDIALNALKSKCRPECVQSGMSQEHREENPASNLKRRRKV
jgi:hypothetical protein